MRFIYQCSKCNKETEAEEFCALVLCMGCMSEMELVKAGSRKINHGLIGKAMVV